VDAFKLGLKENGYVERQNVAIEYRWARGRHDSLADMAKELVVRRVGVLVAVSDPAVIAARAATTEIPIVATFAADAVESGFTTSLGHPDRNITGVSALVATLEPKRLGFLHEVVPNARTIGVLLNPAFPPALRQLKDIEGAARVLGLQINVVRASNDKDIDTAFEVLSESRTPGLIVAADPFFITHRDQLANLALRRAIPTIFSFREYTAAGGLMSYGVSLSEMYRQLGIYAGQVLKGVKPPDLPIVQPTKFEFVINLKTAKALGLSLSDNLLSVADELIE
jgi:putative ABC transport system substrate-binding protein